MAKKATAKAASAKSESKQLQVKVRFNFTDDAGSYYINHAEVTNTQHEFVILCGRLPSKLTPAQRESAKEKSEISIDPLLQLTVPPTLIDGLIQALTTQKAQYEHAYGKIGPQGKAMGDKNVH